MNLRGNLRSILLLFQAVIFWPSTEQAVMYLTDPDASINFNDIPDIGVL